MITKSGRVGRVSAFMKEPPISAMGMKGTTARPEVLEPLGDVACAINVCIGKRIKMIRIANGNSQETIGRMLGLKFQKTQKYKRGSNKISVESGTA
jgi:hypothetical protein